MRAEIYIFIVQMMDFEYIYIEFHRGVTHRFTFSWHIWHFIILPTYTTFRHTHTFTQLTYTSEHDSVVSITTATNAHSLSFSLTIYQRILRNYICFRVFIRDNTYCGKYWRQKLRLKRKMLLLVVKNVSESRMCISVESVCCAHDCGRDEKRISVINEQNVYFRSVSQIKAQESR